MDCHLFQQTHGYRLTIRVNYKHFIDIIFVNNFNKCFVKVYRRAVCAVQYLAFGYDWLWFCLWFGFIMTSLRIVFKVF